MEQKKALTSFSVKVACDVQQGEVMLYIRNIDTFHMRENSQPMQNRNFGNSLVNSSLKPSVTRPASSSVTVSAPPRPTQHSLQRPVQRPLPKKDDLTRIFNTAVVSTQVGAKRDFSAELAALTESAPFKAILNAVRQLSCVQGIPERQAAEEVIAAFRKMDDIWSEYIFKEGLDRLRGTRS